MHTHSENSHDCAEKVENIAKAAADNCAVGIAVTDHCDIEFFDTVDLRKICENSIKDAITCDELLTKLIRDESKFDKLISQEFKVQDYFKNVIKNKQIRD